MAASAWLIVVLIIVLTNKQLLYNAFPASKIIMIIFLDKNREFVTKLQYSF